MSDLTFISRRVTRLLLRLLWGLLAFILVTACGADHSQITPGRSPEAAQTAPAKSVRLVQHLMGETQVPVNPQRVVTLDGVHLSNALALGIQPVGSAAWIAVDLGTGLEPIEPYLRDRSQEVTFLGYIEADLEKILLLKPDLILGNRMHEAIYDQLSQIAPTVLHDFDDWKDIVRFSGDVFGKPQAAEKLVNNYYQRTQTLRQKLRQKTGEHASNLQVSVIRPVSNGARLLYRGSFSGTVLEDVGLSRPSEQDKEGTNVPVSFELIPHMDGDVIFVITYMNDDDADIVNQLKNQPLWSQLEAVKQGNVYPVDGVHWYGWDIVRANIILDDLFKYLLEEE
ncbi:periplasmic binding protein [Leptolyngbya sp. Heron Island J]|uniref:ABC transporter substrate-binding protein n=1 Tax=Leptolyngbya sp. Heron Island J TaxID=1385935 RepID=UPI0003B9AB37|nr:iron-siderophore ABC transporter substrate-binding protein [Leptolyngbya sp. Heron Island J]ESA33730.1 periplasmic binding protein [Leptolyngbya sp. Heron Island J]